MKFKYLGIALLALLALSSAAHAATSASYVNSNGSISTGVVIQCSVDGLTSVSIGTCLGAAPGSSSGNPAYTNVLSLPPLTANSGGFADGAIVTLGTEADSACSTDTGTCTAVALAKRHNQRLSALISGGLPIGQSSSDGSTTQTTGGTAQVLFSGATPPNGFKIAIPAAATSSTPCWLSDTTTTPSATTAGSYPVFQQGQYSSEVGEKPAGAVYINCPTTGQPISAKKW